jgi:anti-sigma factor RsiW
MTIELDDKDYVLLSAYIDGELAPTECRALEDRIAKCPVLTEQFNIMSGQSIVLRNQAKRLLHDPVYPELTSTIEDILDKKRVPPRRHVDESEIHARTRTAANNNTAIWSGIGVAAAVLLAFVGGNWFNRNAAQDGGVASSTPGSAIVASYSPVNNPVLDHEISTTLEKTLSGEIRSVSLANPTEQSDAVQIEPLRTFKQGGRFCREYQVTFPKDSVTIGPDSFYGRACRIGEGEWETVYRLIPGTDLPDLDGTGDTSNKQKL